MNNLIVLLMLGYILYRLHQIVKKDCKVYSDATTKIEKAISNKITKLVESLP